MIKDQGYVENLHVGNLREEKYVEILLKNTLKLTYGLAFCLCIKPMLLKLY